MKKTLALVLALAMVFSTITVAFAEDTLGADAQTCSNLGMLKGETGSVDAAYTATAPTKLQAAIMVLRLKGLEAEALAFTGTDNFADAGQVNWAGGKAIMAYLKANPQLGWVGDGVNFNPNEKLTAQMYYKVMLEVLGYKQSTPEVVGDFAWADVFTFAASVGLSKVATVANFTVNDLAVATVEALNLKVKGGDKTLAATLVEAGKMDKAAAIAAGLYADAVTTTAAKLDSAFVVGNTVVVAEFDTEVEKAFAENAANFKVVEKGTTTEVAVSAAVLDGTKQVVLTTAALTAGKAYTLTVGDVSKNFAGVAKDTAVPEIDKVEGTDTERVVITFKTAMDLATAFDPANYAIAGVTVKSVAWDDDEDRDAVELTTEGLAANKTYKVTVTNVKSVDGVILKSASKNFVSKTDKKAPVLDTAKADTNTRVLVKFTDDNELTKESAENVANYRLTYGSSNELEITAAKLVEDEDDDLKWVELTTASQKTSQKYTLRVNNITDTSVLGNKMTKEDTVSVYGVKVDTDEPSFSSLDYLSKNIITVTFTDKSRLDFATAQDINNYEINNDVAIEKVEMTDADDADCKKVKLYVSDLEDKTSYKVTVSNVADEYGNAMDDTSKSKGYKSAYDTVATIERIVTPSTDEVVVIFTKELDEASAEDVANYSISGDIGAPKDATYDAEDDTYANNPTVTLETGDMTINSGYKLTINGVKDEADRVLTNVSSSFRVARDDNDYEKPELEDVEAVNNKVVRVTYSEAMSTLGTNDELTLNVGGTLNDAGAVVGGRTLTAKGVVSYDDDDMVIEYTIQGNTASDKFLEADDVVYVTDVHTTDAAGNAVDMENIPYEFSPESDAPDKVDLDSYDQVNVRKFQLQYSEKIDEAVNGTIIESTTNSTFNVEVDEDDNTIVYVEKVSGILDDDHVYKFDFSGMLMNYHGVEVIDPDNGDITELESYILDEDDPYIESVEAADMYKVKVTFNEDLKESSPGSYTIKYENDEGDEKSVTISSTAVDSDDENVVNITLSKALEAKYMYTLYQGASKATDLSGNKIDADSGDDLYDFMGTNVEAINDYITGVKLYNGTKIRVYTNDDHATVTASIYKKGAKTEANEVELVNNVGGTGNADDNYYTFNIRTDNSVPVTAFMEDTTYTVYIGQMSYDFEGIVEDGITVDLADPAVDNTFAVSYDDSEKDDIVAFISATGTFVISDTIAKDGEDAILATTDAVVAVVVVRNGVVIYYKDLYTLPTL